MQQMTLKNILSKAKKTLLLILCSLVITTNNVVWANKPPSPPTATCTLPITVGDTYIRSFDSNDIDNLDKQAAEADRKQADHEIRPAQLDAHTIRKTIFNNILAKSAKLQAVQQQMEPILNPYAWSDLKLFYGTTTAPSYHLMSRINRTTTILGEAVLAILLVTPTSDIATLQAKQQKLKTLLTNPTQLATIISHLKGYQEVEQSVTSYWTTRDPLYTKEYVKYMEDNFYAAGKAASNKSAGWLEFKKRFFKDFWGIQYRFIYPITSSLVGEIFFSKTMGMGDVRKDVWLRNIPYYGGWRDIKIISNETQKMKALGRDTSNRGFMYVRPVVSELGWTLVAYSGIKNYLEYSSVLRNLAMRMADVQTFIKTATQVSNTIATSPELEAAFGDHVVAIRKLLAQSKEKTELGKLIHYLQKLPFNNWSYFFNNAGKLLAAHTLFVEHKDAFADAMYELGLLDAHCSFATLMQEAQAYHSEHAYVFVEFIEHTKKSKPYIAAENMWNSFLDSKQAVGNHLTMDATIKGGVRNVILTGPNAGGKSTFLTGVTQSLLLAQVMGIAAADQFVFTPFHKINTYIDIADDISAGKSLFLAEVDRAQQHIQILKDLKPEEFSFTIFDEPFSGTNPIEGAAAEYSVLESLADYTNSFTIVATHYPLIMLLEEKAKHKGFANYKVYITHQGTARKLNYTYKVIPGKSTQTIAIDILEEMGYDTKLLHKAREIIEHPERYQAKF